MAERDQLVIGLHQQIETGNIEEAYQQLRIIADSDPDLLERLIQHAVKADQKVRDEAALKQEERVVGSTEYYAGPERLNHPLVEALDL